MRGSGLLAGLKLKVAPAELVSAALAEKLLLVGAGENVVRLLPPLIVSDEEIAEANVRLSRALYAHRCPQKLTALPSTGR